MSDYDGNRSNDTSDEAGGGGADNSIIGKVKSRVSSIIPHSLTKWFSPSTKTNDSMNGSLNMSGSGIRNNARRRRRIELDEDEEEEDDEDVVEEEEEDEDDEEQHHSNDSLRLQPDANTDEESNNSADVATSVPSVKVRQTISASSNAVRQPPSKRSRFALDITNKRSSPSIQLIPLQSSTPSASGSMRDSVSYRRTLEHGRSTATTSINRYTQLNMYSQQSKKEPAYNFNPVPTKTELVAQFEASQSDAPPTSSTSGVSLRRSLNISSPLYRGVETHTNLSNLKRQSLASSGKADTYMASTSNKDKRSSNFGILPSRTSTTILEIENCDDDEDDPNTIIEEPAEIIEDSRGLSKYNGGTTVGSNAISMSSKRQRLINGVENETGAGVSGSAENLVDTASESSDGVGLGEGNADMNSNINRQRKTGLFNMSGTNSRNGSRTSSFGNGLNFYSHLEGRKSLFSGAQGQTGNPLNNSTLSLTSLNRRQFNASIYGSTSALSDSRLLNTFSPFYKGRTTYGGAAAYNRFGASTGAGASAMRITPTLIRPTSSLSTLSSSNNSLAATGANPTTESGSAISSTAKRILDLINDFTTPLSEAKKMATSLKSNSQQPQQQLLLPHNRSRLSEADLHESRTMRLSQVRTPYMRPMVTLHPTHINGKATAHSMQSPPVRELQVPSMSQLLQMKKLQSTTERSREIAQQNSASSSQRSTITSNEYTLPIQQSKEISGSGGGGGGSGGSGGISSQQQKHNNKIRAKIATHARVTSLKDDDDAPPLPANLPNIEFPTMQSVPKIDINLPTSNITSTNSGSKTSITEKSTTMKFGFPAASSTTIENATLTSSGNKFAFNPSKQTTTKSPAATTTAASPITMASTAKNTFTSFSNANTASTQSSTNFKFSSPLELTAGSTEYSRNGEQYKYTFSPPMQLQSGITTSPAAKVEQKTNTTPQLKTGSVLDALKKPFALPTTTSSSATSSSSIALTTTTTTTISAQSINASTIGFGSQFKKPSNEWECDTCLVRNKADASKCVACETSRKTSMPTALPPLSASQTLTAAPLSTSTFGMQFKKAANEWECDSCMVRNKAEVTKCVACETPRKGATVTNVLILPTTSAATAPIKNTFGDAFKPKSNTWECPTCLIQNKSETVQCVACETKKPGATTTIAPTTTTTIAATAAAPAFKFGFAGTEQKAADVGFKAIAAAQSASKWECEACMTRNDAARNKCVCCEQAKPGSQSTTATDAAPKFAFGSSAAAKFSFGFGNANTATSKPDDGQSLQTTTANATAKTDLPSKGFTFGTSAPAASSFSFGTKPTTTTVSTDSADAAPKMSAAPTGFTFGVVTSTSGASTTVTATVAATTTTAATTIPTFAFKPPAANQSSTNAVTSSAPPAFGISSTQSPSSVKFGLTPSSTPAAPTAAASAPNANSELGKSNASTISFAFGTANTSNASASNATTPAGGFSFGAPAAKVSETTAISTSTAPATASMSGFAFKAPATVSTVTTSTSAMPATPAFRFGAPTTTTSASSSPTTSSAATSTAKPIFGFGAATTAANNNVAVAVPNATATAASGGSISSGFSFGGGSVAPSTPSASKSLFGSPLASSSASSTAGSETNSGTAETVTATNTAKVFGSFDNSAASTAHVFGTPAAVATSMFGANVAKPVISSSSVLASPLTATTTTTSSSSTSTSFTSNNNNSSTFGTFGATVNENNKRSASTNLFGSFGDQQQQPQQQQGSDAKVAAVANTSVFGNVNNTTMMSPSPSATTTMPSGGATPFLFGSGSMAAPNAQAAPASNNSGGAVAVTTTATSTWPQSSFVFGSGGAGGTGGAGVGAGNINTTASNTASKSVFGSFGAAQQPQQQSTATNVNATASAPTGLIFGSLANTASPASAPAPAFGSVAAAGNSASNIFGSVANTNAQSQGASNIFGANPSTNTNNNTNNNSGLNAGATTLAPQPAVAFGAATFGSGAAAPTFGSAATTAPFGGFAAPATNITGNNNNNNNNDGASAAKKAEPAFNFGSTGTQGSTGGFNFGSNAATTKAAFNFTPTSQPAFNFTGSTEQPIQQQTQAIKPFQFGAPTAAPVYNFSGSAVEATPNAPFQFNAGASSPATMNIFAPNPTPGTQTAQQARRKMRAPIRRLTPR